MPQWSRTAPTSPPHLTRRGRTPTRMPTTLIPGRSAGVRRCRRIAPTCADRTRVDASKHRSATGGSSGQLVVDRMFAPAFLARYGQFGAVVVAVGEATIVTVVVNTVVNELRPH